MNQTLIKLRGDLSFKRPYTLHVLISCCVSAVCSDKDCLHPLYTADLRSKCKQTNCLSSVLIPVCLTTAGRLFTQRGLLNTQSEDRMRVASAPQRF